MSDGSWNNILDNGEEILWAGRPDGTFIFKRSMIVRGIIGLLFVALAIGGLIHSYRIGQLSGVFLLFLLGFGLWMVLMVFFGDHLHHRNTRYALTNKRSLVETKSLLGGVTLKWQPIGKDTVVDFRDGHPPSVVFNTQTNGNAQPARAKAIRFARIDEAQTVLAHLRRIQKDAI